MTDVVICNKTSAVLNTENRDKVHERSNDTAVKSALLLIMLALNVFYLTLEHVRCKR